MTLTSLLSEDIYCHSNGLKHINTIDKKGFSALVVVNTPVFDNTGVAHGVEHMVFRGSKAFPHPETLFQLTSLTDVKINASTLAQTTYFHCQSECKQTFMLAVNYLLSGLYTPVFSYKDLQHEIHDGHNKGVVYHELIGIEQAKGKRQAQHESCDFYYGGKSELIGKLTVQDLIQYHQRFYHASNMTLVTANADVEEISSLIALLPKQDQVTTEASNVIDKYSINPQKNKTNTSEQTKYSQAINKLITLYDLWLKDPYYQEIDDYNEIGGHIKNTDIKGVVTKNSNAVCLPLQNNLFSSLSRLSSALLKEENYTQKNNIQVNNTQVKNTQLIKCNIKSIASHAVLPNLFEKLYQQAQKELTSSRLNLTTRSIFVNAQNNTLWLATIDEDEQSIAMITSYIISAYPQFLASRCQGSCYATQALVVENLKYLIIYNAFDASPNTRLEEISSALLSLSQNRCFIRESLALAKIKYCRVNQVQYDTLKVITPTNICSYLKRLLR